MVGHTSGPMHHKLMKRKLVNFFIKDNPIPYCPLLVFFYVFKWKVFDLKSVFLSSTRYFSEYVSLMWDCCCVSLCYVAELLFIGEI